MHVLEDEQLSYRTPQAPSDENLALLQRHNDLRRGLKSSFSPSQLRGLGHSARRRFSPGAGLAIGLLLPKVHRL